MKSSAAVWRIVMLAVASPIFLAGPASAGTISYSYDQLGRLTSAAYPNGALIRYNYDKNGNRTTYVVTGSTNPVPSGTPPVGQATVVGTATQTAPTTTDPPGTISSAK